MEATLAEPVDFPVGSAIYPHAPSLSIALADLDGDSALDLAVAARDVVILPGSGDGAFGQAFHCAAGDGPRAVAIGDIEGDGALDLATANFRSNDASVLLGSGDGAFGQAVHHAVGEGPQSIAPGDLDGDGKTDLAVANRQSNDVSILLAQ